MMQTGKTLVEVIEILRERGYTEDFNLLEEGISYRQDGGKIDLNDLVIDKTYRFSGMNDPDDEAILYAIHNKRDGVKGILVNSYGIYSDEKANAIIRQISTEDDGHDWVG